MSAVVEKTIRLNGAPVTTAAETYADLRTDAVDTLIVNGHARPWQQMVIEGDDVLLFAADKRPSPALWRAIYDARYGRDVMDRLQAGSVAICGLGGLGSLVALELGRLGVGRLLLIDGDVVDPTNLERQHYFASQIGLRKTDALASTLAECAPLTAVEKRSVWLDGDNIASLLAHWPIICECVDRPETKALLTQSVLSELPDATLVGASGMAGYGSGNAIVTKRVLPRLYMTGDGASEGEEGIGLMAPRVGLCASAQATMVMRLLLGEPTS